MVAAKYQFDGKEKNLSLGTYPEISIKEARERCMSARTDVAKGIDPATVRKVVKGGIGSDNENSFEFVAKEWIVRKGKLWAPTHTSKIIRRLELDLYPILGARHIADIKAFELLKAIQLIEERGAIDTAHRALQNCGQIFRYGVATGRVPRDITADLRGALSPVKKGHFPAVTDPKAIGGLLRTMDTYTGSVVTRSALRLAPLVFVRPGELRKAKWKEFDFDAAIWSIPAERMKTREAHIVPLSRQALEILQELHAFTEKATSCFPAPAPINGLCPIMPFSARYGAWASPRKK